MSKTTNEPRSYQYLSVAERIDLLSMPEPNSGCWLWLGFLNRNGYASIRDAGKHHGAHRVSYEHFIGPIPDGLVLDHKCRTPACINPLHLEPVTPAENTRRGREATKTHCKRGHPLTPDNLYAGNGRRQCGTCKREWMDQYRARKKLPQSTSY